MNVKFLFYFLITNFLWMYCLTVDVCQNKMFSRDCASVCHCKNDSPCDVITGACSTGCASGWEGVSCQKANVAYERESEQKDGKSSEPSAYALDDDVATCSTTKANVPGWWMVKLDHVTNIETVQILSSPNTNIRNWRVYAGMEESIYSMTLCAVVGIHGNGATVKCDLPIVGQYVMVVNRMTEVILCNFEIYVCSQFWFGDNCDKRCNCADALENCDTKTGACATGCSPGWMGSDCQSRCVQRYGPNCSTPCGHCLDSGQCDVQTGHCPRGCQPGWTGHHCTRRCDDDTYGSNCASKCGNCRRNGTCDSESGKCPDGCDPGYRGDQCEIACNIGWYGENCLSQCGNCSEGLPCDVTTGLCHKGCAPGWEGMFCSQVCLTGFYGDMCKSTCHMCLNRNCDPVTGACRDGCGPGYKGDSCTQKCLMGHYGRNCEHSCGRCLHKNDEYCDVTNGTCLHGCEAGYNGTLCDKPCKAGYYGLGCQKCGLCKAGSLCNVVTGVCPDGCGLNFHGDKCLQADAFSDQDGPQLRVFLGSTIGFVGGIMTIVVICLVFTWQREHLPTMAEIKMKSTKKQTLVESKPFIGVERSPREKVEIV